VTHLMNEKTEDPSDGLKPRESTERRVRADAQRNINALLQSAMTVFATSGVDAPVREIAEKAGVTLLSLLCATHHRQVAPDKMLTHGEVIRASLGATAEIHKLAKGEFHLQYTLDSQSLKRTLLNLLPVTIPLAWFQFVPQTA